MYQKGGIFDNRLLEPEKFHREVDFKEWVEDFREYIEVQDENLAELLDFARDSKEAITHAGVDEERQRNAKVLYGSLKRSVTHTDARSLVVNVAGNHPFEAWRKLFMKYDPRNDSISQNIVDTIWIRTSGAARRCRMCRSRLPGGRR